MPTSFACSCKGTFWYAPNCNCRCAVDLLTVGRSLSLMLGLCDKILLLGIWYFTSCCDHLHLRWLVMCLHVSYCTDACVQPHLSFLQRHSLHHSHNALMLRHNITKHTHLKLQAISHLHLACSFICVCLKMSCQVIRALCEWCRGYRITHTQIKV